MYHRKINKMRIDRSISIFRGRNKNYQMIRFVSIIIRLEYYNFAGIFSYKIVENSPVKNN